MGVFESVENADSAGSITLLPYAGYGDYPFSISVAGSGGPNGGSGTTRHSSKITASGDGKTVIANSNLREDPEIKSVIDTTWGYKVIMGNSNQENSLNQFTNIVSHPGYMTFPTSSSRLSVTTGMTLQALDDKGQPLFDKIYVPNVEFGEPQITLSAVKTEYDDVYMKTNLGVSARW